MVRVTEGQFRVRDLQLAECRRLVENERHPVTGCLAGATGTRELSARTRIGRAIASLGGEYEDLLDSSILIELSGPGGPRSRLDPHLELAVAVAILVASGSVDRRSVDGLLVLGELAADGDILPIRGTLAAAEWARALGLRGVVAPRECTWEVSLAGGIWAYPAETLADIVGKLADGRLAPEADPATQPIEREANFRPDMADLRGMPATLDAVATAALAGRGILLIGASGTHRIARRVAGILPALTAGQVISVTRAHSALGMATGPIRERPFRAPHCSISSAALAGLTMPSRAGNPAGTPRPGELALATCGVLFLDQISRFSEGAICALANGLRRVTRHARPLVIAGDAASPCGARRPCECAPADIERHQRRVAMLAGMLGLAEWIEVPDAVRDAPEGESSA